jgi:hypothetical protein
LGVEHDQLGSGGQGAPHGSETEGEGGCALVSPRQMSAATGVVVDYVWTLGWWRTAWLNRQLAAKLRTELQVPPWAERKKEKKHGRGN